MNKQSKGLPKAHFVVYVTDFTDTKDIKQAFNHIKMTNAAFNYPFGMRKLDLHGPEKTDKGYRVYASVYMTVDQYVRKCAYSGFSQLRAMCHAWLSQYSPEKVDYFKHVCWEADQIKNQKESN